MQGSEEDGEEGWPEVVEGMEGGPARRQQTMNVNIAIIVNNDLLIRVSAPPGRLGDVCWSFIISFSTAVRKACNMLIPGLQCDCINYRPSCVCGMWV